MMVSIGISKLPGGHFQVRTVSLREGTCFGGNQTIQINGSVKGFPRDFHDEHALFGLLI